MGVSLNKKGMNSKDIVNKICKVRQIIVAWTHYGGIKIYLWTQKKRLGKSMVESGLAMDVKYNFLRQRNKENY